MKKRRYIEEMKRFQKWNPFLMFFLLYLHIGWAQLSPGKLSNSHSKLEGLSNCTQCHEIGNKISSSKCLACHKDLRNRIQEQKGYHASAAIKGKDCIQCHSEHHGEKFQMIHFDKKSFDHKQTGFALEGAHATKIKDCKECHQSKNISSPIHINKKNTFMGLTSKCLSCHENYHQNKLSENCTSCHEMATFKGAKKFNHTQTKFPLEGKHEAVNCKECHQKSSQDPQKPIDFSKAETNCASCHTDKHKGKFGNQCAICHQEESFEIIRPTKAFNHKMTGFQLEGKHREISCQKCHVNSKGQGKFNEFRAKVNLDCITCHKDVHEGKLGTDCKKCHNQQSFLLKNKSFVGAFDHAKTDYPLKGKHEKVDCKACHKGDFTDPLPFNSCMNCHKDEHRGDFNYKEKKYSDCSACHEVDGFSPSKFGLKEHQKSIFPLDGGHIAQPCFACHMKENKWKFSKIGTDCLSCHADIHKEALDPKYKSEGNCKSCHSTQSWSNVQFDHQQTDFALIGKHQQVNCRKCHFIKNDKSYLQVFKNLEKKCLNCHKDVHGGQFQVNGVTDCEKCHNSYRWAPSQFDHNTASFRLDGQHSQVACEKCHQTFLPGSIRIRNYKLTKSECVDCHL